MSRMEMMAEKFLYFLMVYPPVSQLCVDILGDKRRLVNSNPDYYYFIIILILPIYITEVSSASEIDQSARIPMVWIPALTFWLGTTSGINISKGRNRSTREPNRIIPIFWPFISSCPSFM